MARQLVESLSAEWEPAKYTDEYKENLMRRHQGKLKGKTPRLKEREPPQQAEVIDLMARLRASLEGRGRRARPRKGAARTALAKRRRPRSRPLPVARTRGNGGWRDAGLDRHPRSRGPRWSTGIAGTARARARCSI